MKIIKQFSILFSMLFSFLLTIQTVNASEGTVELKSTTNSNYRCYATSIQMIDLNYNVSITCRDLLYPSGDDIFNYMLWATQVKDGKPLKLGALGLGRAAFKTIVPFSNLFVTTESNVKSKTPTGTTVMAGDVKPIAFLQETKPQPEETQTPAEEETPTPTGQSTKDRLVSGLKRAALVSLFALLALVGLVFVLTRKR
jgi:hypothetical protein